MPNRVPGHGPGSVGHHRRVAAPAGRNFWFKLSWTVRSESSFKTTYTCAHATQTNLSINERTPQVLESLGQRPTEEELFQMISEVRLEL